MTLQEKVINGIIDREGGYANDPKDSGGETMYGITVAVARRYGYMGVMKAMPRALAFQIYVDLYWKPLGLDQIEALSPAIAEELADTGVNTGTRRAGIFLQRSLNVFNREQSDYRDIVADGQVGPGTLQALTDFLRRRGKEGERVMLAALNCLQGAFYIGLAESRQKDEKFVYGWILNRVTV